MKRQIPGQVNAYILNLMIHSDTLRLDEQEIRDRIEDRFKQSKRKRIRPQNVRKFHIEPLIERRWLREVNGKYERIGELMHVRPEWTLIDQFEGLPEEYVDSYIYSTEYNRNMFGSEDFEGSLTEKEYNDYFLKEYESSYENDKNKNRELTPEEIETQNKDLGIA